MLLFEKLMEPVLLQMTTKPKCVLTNLQTDCHLTLTLR